jgi:hypothetical protein
MITAIDAEAIKKLIPPHSIITRIDYEIEDDDAPEFVEDLLCRAVSAPITFEKPYYLIIDQINNLALLGKNWDGFGGMSLSSEVIEKSKSLIEHLSDESFLSYDYEVKMSPYNTIIIDWYSGENEFSLEIGTDSVAYFSEGKSNLKVDELLISEESSLMEVALKIEKDLENAL